LFGDGYTTKGYGLVIESDDCPIDIWNPRSKERRLEYDVTVTAGKWRMKTATKRGTTVSLSLSTSKETMMLLAQDLTNAYNVNCSVALALKNAGDWGQIEHCRQLGAVFVTCDKLAAFYAAYRNVPFMYINHHDYLQEGPKGSFLHYSFVMSDKRTTSPPVVAAPPLAVSRWAPLWVSRMSRCLRSSCSVHCSPNDCAVATAVFIYVVHLFFVRMTKGIYVYGTRKKRAISAAIHLREKCNRLREKCNLAQSNAMSEQLKIP
jgi:hypothetical protein